MLFYNGVKYSSRFYTMKKFDDDLRFQELFYSLFTLLRQFELQHFF